MKDNFEVYSQILCNSTNLKLDAETLISMYNKASLSIEGSMNGVQERSTVFYLNKFLRKCEQDEVIYNVLLFRLELFLSFKQVEILFHLVDLLKRLTLILIMLCSRAQRVIHYQQARHAI
jgi:hypothetical protein